MANRIGTQIAGYRIESLLSRGGMGEIYLEQDAPKRNVALKLPLGGPLGRTSTV